ncbi:hypothetical protein GFB49_18970 [Epibacterium sp. SM1979]|uniref:Uncharacterized protein n=1 Tax=Tritonibacter litoralis TaxID=2662264 RepID=A0A843YHA4_9RHOB|nr:hypothetical protein [Tritonibacter litoralis]MQQ10546.1 hypothetical protein [Tritonibacter litoralis]
MLDDKSEIIAHFIGIFELNVEAARMKIQYQEMQAWLSPQPDLGPLLNITINVSSAYNLSDFEPDLGWRTTIPASPLLFVNTSIPAAPAYAAPYVYDFFPKLFFDPALFSPVILSGEPVFFIQPPSSAASITVQTNWLQDHDLLLTYDAGVEFLPAASFDAMLLDLAEYAQTLHVLNMPEMAEDEDSMIQNAAEMHETLGHIADHGVPLSATDADVYVAHGDDALSVTVNGAATDALTELPEISIHFASETSEDEDEEDATDGAKTAEGEEITQEFDGTPDSPDNAEDPPHELTTGGNIALNEARIASDWLDASVVTVMGHHAETIAVSQVNIWNDTDIINGQVSETSEGSTAGINGFSFEMTSSPRPAAESEDGEPGPPPSFAAITEIDGNLINYNYVKQFNFASDNDVVSVQFEAQDSYFQTGGNFLSNGFGLLGLGFHYDLIVVGGNMVDMKFISQTNVLLDSDVLYHQAGFEGSISTSDNLLFNSASIRQIGTDQIVEMNQTFADASEAVMRGDTDIGAARNDEAFVGTDLLRILNIKGDIVDVQMVEQFNLLGDADQIAWASETAQSIDGADVSVISGENELINMASIIDAGIDSRIYTSEGAYTESFLYQADFISEEDPVLAAENSGLTGEAFLFLADGLIPQDEGGDDHAISTPLPTEVSVDVMQSVLA